MIIVKEISTQKRPSAWREDFASRRRMRMVRGRGGKRVTRGDISNFVAATDWLAFSEEQHAATDWLALSRVVIRGTTWNWNDKTSRSEESHTRRHGDMSTSCSFLAATGCHCNSCQSIWIIRYQGLRPSWMYNLNWRNDAIYYCARGNRHWKKFSVVAKNRELETK